MKKIILSVVFLSICCCPIFSWATVFINEIHYDNVGIDVGEAIEIAGSAGTDLAGWSIVLYNGTDGVAYDTISLSGIIPNQLKGFGTLAFYPHGIIQNGSPDGIALIDPSYNVIQFLSYEGSFMTNAWPIAGMYSTDILVFEDSNTPVGYSLQNSVLSLDEPPVVSWYGPSHNTFGSLNEQQRLKLGFRASPEIMFLLLSE